MTEQENGRGVMDEVGVGGSKALPAGQASDGGPESMLAIKQSGVKF